MGRDGKRGKGRDAKGRGGGRGGGGSKMYIDNIEELQMRERGPKPGDDDDSEEEEGGEGEGAKPAESVFAFERKAKPAPTRASNDDDEEEDESHGGKSTNPNHAPSDPNNPEGGMNRKEREALAAQKAKEDYQKRHMAGETERAREELARLALVRARRDAAAKQREAEGRAPGMSAGGLDSDASDDEKPAAAPAAAPAPDSLAAKKRAAAAAPAEDESEKGADGPPKLKSIDIKKMNGDQLKDHCKERGISIQGQKKELMQRLLDHEAARK